MPQAPNKLNELIALKDANPKINTRRDGPFAPNRGGITQLAALTFGFPFGRKSRDRSDTNLSDDALTYRVGAHHFEIYDIINGATGGMVWSYMGTFADGQNGYFVVPGGGGAPPAPGPDPEDDDEDAPSPGPAPPGGGGGGGGGGGNRGKGHDRPRIPTGMHADALAVGKAVRKEVEAQIGPDVPAGIRDRSGANTDEILPGDVTDDIKEVIVAIAVVATHFAIIVGATGDTDVGMIEDMMSEVMPPL
jgi:hypothetical protein